MLIAQYSILAKVLILVQLLKENGRDVGKSLVLEKEDIKIGLNVYRKANS